MTKKSCQEQGRKFVVPRSIRISAVLKQCPNHLCSSLCGGAHQGRRAVRITGVDLNATRQNRLHLLGVISFGNSPQSLRCRVRVLLCCFG
jgi:hypothetical protein